MYANTYVKYTKKQYWKNIKWHKYFGGILVISTKLQAHVPYVWAILVVGIYCGIVHNKIRNELPGGAWLINYGISAFEIPLHPEEINEEAL